MSFVGIGTDDREDGLPRLGSSCHFKQIPMPFRNLHLRISVGTFEES